MFLPYLQPLADRRGFGDAWRNMTTLKTREAAAEAAAAAAPSRTPFNSAKETRP